MTDQTPNSVALERHAHPDHAGEDRESIERPFSLDVDRHVVDRRSTHVQLGRRNRALLGRCLDLLQREPFVPIRLLAFLREGHHQAGGSRRVSFPLGNRPDERTLELGVAERRFIRMAAIVLYPLAMLGMGIVVWARRRRKDV